MGDVIEFAGVAKLREEIRKRDEIILKLVAEYKELHAKHLGLQDRNELTKLQMVEVLTGLATVARNLSDVATTLNTVRTSLEGK